MLKINFTNMSFDKDEDAYLIEKKRNVNNNCNSTCLFQHNCVAQNNLNDAKSNSSNLVKDYEKKDDLNYQYYRNYNSKGFWGRLTIVLVGVIFIAMNSLTNMLVTDEESIGMKDKLISFLSFYTNFLSNDKTFYSKAVNMVISYCYDLFIITGIFIWIFKSKSNKVVYSTVFFFTAMIFLQNLFLIKKPFFKQNKVSIDEIAYRTIFLNYSVNNNPYYNGHVGFLLIILFEFLDNRYIKCFSIGLLYFVNLIAYLIALHCTNTLCVISSILAALYFNKISAMLISHKIDILETLTDYLTKNSNIKSNQNNSKLSHDDNIPKEKNKSPIVNLNASKLYVTALPMNPNPCENNDKDKKNSHQVKTARTSIFEEEKDEINEEFLGKAKANNEERCLNLNASRIINRRSYEKTKISEGINFKPIKAETTEKENNEKILNYYSQNQSLIEKSEEIYYNTKTSANNNSLFVLNNNLIKQKQ